MTPEALDTLRTTLTGDALTPTDAAFPDSLVIWNGTVDKHPALIVRCATNDDVIAAVNFARDQGLGVSVRAGGHHVAGSSLIEDGLVIDLAQMRGVEVDPAARTVRAQGGALIGDVDRATQEHGLAVPLGLVSETGVAGLTLAGGLGWMRRKHGLSSDNLIAADVVTADGALVHASPTENADLFWALRGAGWDLGVVVNFEYQAHPLGPEVWVPFVAYAWADAKQVIQRFREFAASAPEGLSLICVCWTVPEIDAFPKDAWGQRMVVILGPYIGTVEEGREASKDLPSFGTVLADLSGEMPWTEAQLLFDEDYPKGRRYYWRSTYLQDLPDAAIDVLIDRTEKRPSLLTSLDIWQLGGAIDRVGPTDTPIAHRGAPYLIGIEANWENAADDAANRDWTKAVSAALEPFSTGGSYMNFEDPDDVTATAAAYGANLDRLRAVKQQYDPNNLFRSRRGLA